MRKAFTLLFLGIFSLSAKAQKLPAPAALVQPYGTIDTADLRMQSCDFEKDANAEVLLDKADVEFYENGTIKFIRHKRIKIFNNNGKNEANIKIKFVDRLSGVKAETINLTGSTITYTPVDVNLIYKKKIDQNESELAFTFPAVNVGSIIEFQYQWDLFDDYIPAWYFQSDIPTRYSEIAATMDVHNLVNVVSIVNQPFVTDSVMRAEPNGTKNIKGLANIRSIKTELYMTPFYDNLQRILFKPYANIWLHICYEALENWNYSKLPAINLSSEDELLMKIDTIKSYQAKIDSIFNLVKNRMTWNGVNAWFITDGIKKAWDKKTGNSTEINLVLNQMLNRAGIKANPILVSTPDYDVVDPTDADLSQFNKTVVYVAIDNINHYVLDATDKRNTFNQVPFNLLGTYGLEIDPETGVYNAFPIYSKTIAKQLVNINAIIDASGKMAGTADILSDGYSKTNSLALYNNLGETSYIKHLVENDNTLQITSLTLEDTEADTLPLKQHIQFNHELSASDKNYIFFNPNLFTSFGTNPFLSEDRFSNIDFIYNTSYIISGTYNIPDGYKIDFLPKNQVMFAEDKSISFRRIIGEQEGAILVRYVITRNRNFYSKAEYKGLYLFYKKMFELLNEQIVLKKS